MNMDKDKEMDMDMNRAHGQRKDTTNGECNKCKHNQSSNRMESKDGE